MSSAKSRAWAAPANFSVRTLLLVGGILLGRLVLAGGWGRLVGGRAGRGSAHVYTLTTPVDTDTKTHTHIHTYTQTE